MKKIPLGDGTFATVDDCDYERVRQHTWFPIYLETDKGEEVHAARWITGPDGKRSAQLMEYFILGVPGNLLPEIAEDDLDSTPSETEH